MDTRPPQNVTPNLFAVFTQRTGIAPLDQVRDAATGLEGKVVGISEKVSGSVSVLVQPPSTEGIMPRASWISLPRVQRVSSADEARA